MIDYDGKDITIEEMPSGCVITSKLERFRKPKEEITIASVEDALALIESLGRMIKVFSNNQGME